MSLLWHRGGWTFVARTPSEAAGAVRHGLPIVADRMQQGELACCRQLAGGHPRGHDREPSRPPTPMDAPLRDQLSITGPHRAGAPAPSPECRWTDFGEQTRTGFRERYRFGDKPAARTTAATPPRPMALASAPASRRRVRSSAVAATASNRSLISASRLASMLLSTTRLRWMQASPADAAPWSTAIATSWC